MEWYRLVFIALFSLSSAKLSAEAVFKTLPITTNPGLNKNFPPLNPATSPEMDPSLALTPAARPEPSKEAARNTASAEAPAQTAIQALTQPVADAPLLPPAAEASIILSRNRFYPSKIQMPAGTKVRIWFTTVESKPAALIIEGLKMQRWIASENSSLTPSNTPDYFELQREITRERVTEITLQPSAGTYPFFDALSGARGEIVVQ